MLYIPLEFSFNFRRFAISTGGGDMRSVTWLGIGFVAREEEDTVVVVEVVREEGVGGGAGAFRVNPTVG